LILALALGGCASVVADMPLVGVPANAPPRPETSGSYLPVHDVPPPRQDEMMSLAEQTRIANELTEARAKGQATAASDAAAIAAAAPPAPAAKAKPTAKKKPEKDAKAAQ
jgi:hypothetical protein